MDHSEGLGPEAAICHSMAAVVTMELHLWLNLADIEEREKAFLLDSSISPYGLFGDTVYTVVDWYQEVKHQSAAFKELIPRQVQEVAASSSRDQPGPRSKKDDREEQKENVAFWVRATHTTLPWGWTDLREVISTRAAEKKQSRLLWALVSESDQGPRKVFKKSVQEKCSFSKNRKPLSRGGLDLNTMQTHLSPAHAISILNTVKGIRLGQELSVLQVKNLFGGVLQLQGSHDGRLSQGMGCSFRLPKEKPIFFHYGQSTFRGI